MESIKQFWKTTTGKLVFGAGLLSGLLMLCAICAICGLISNSSDETSSEVEEVAKVARLADMIEATDTPEPTSTLVPSATPEPTHTPEPSPTDTVVVLPTDTVTATPLPTEPPPTEPLPTDTPVPVEPPTDTPAPPPPTEAPAAPPVVGGPLTIVDVNDSEEYAEIQNISDGPVDLGGWRLFSQRGAQNCDLGGVIQPGQVLRIWALSEDAGQGGFNCGFGTNIWNNSEPDPAILIDPNGAEISKMD
jgi:hypothetical protein